MSIKLRAVLPEDEEFLFQIYAATRREEVAAWGWDPVQQGLFLKMQFRGQQQAYEMMFRDMDHSLILLNEHPVGRILIASINQTIRLIDIAVLPEYRGNGVGSCVLQDLVVKAETEGIPVQLQVQKNNLQAIQLYQRLGFLTIGESSTHFLMEHCPKA